PPEGVWLNHCLRNELLDASIYPVQIVSKARFGESVGNNLRWRRGECINPIALVASRQANSVESPRSWKGPQTLGYEPSLAKIEGLPPGSESQSSFLGITNFHVRLPQIEHIVETGRARRVLAERPGVLALCAKLKPVGWTEGNAKT